MGWPGWLRKCPPPPSTPPSPPPPSPSPRPGPQPTHPDPHSSPPPLPLQYPFVVTLVERQGLGIVVVPSDASPAGTAYFSDLFGNTIRSYDFESMQTSIVRDDLYLPKNFALAPDKPQLLYFVSENQIMTLDLRSYAVEVVAGTGGQGAADGTALEASFVKPRGLAVIEGGRLIIADVYNKKLRELSNGYVSTFTDLVFNPKGLAYDSHSSLLYVVDTACHVAVLDLASMEMHGIAGTHGSCGTEDGRGDVATFKQPGGIVLSHDRSTLYVADYYSIRAIDLTSGDFRRSSYIVSTILPSIGLQIEDVHIDGNGNLVFTDYYGRRVRQLVLGSFSQPNAIHLMLCAEIADFFLHGPTIRYTLCWSCCNLLLL
ncbi:hypothetical protein DUNSADRAFT_14533 [Dunaliella salina]|uniref:Uncharacterized protein n=1 Tax=Dunaliella salina TaxID=3046 RepID=A0ABQ7G793_DUNSA|nr:hypothetical protein DUNSADRAFT_14533 [Dunaliella salina]|eukprot:KAF5830476.1 hypothetical protein DUNSADRAFT_14533 [Dunaliella salina]